MESIYIYKGGYNNSWLFFPESREGKVLSGQIKEICSDNTLFGGWPAKVIVEGEEGTEDYRVWWEEEDGGFFRLSGDYCWDPEYMEYPD